MVGDNKLCGIYLIFHLDLNYIMGSQRQWTVFELLDLLSAYVHGFMLMSHARNGDEFRTPRHRGSPANVEVLAFVILVNPKPV